MEFSDEFLENKIIDNIPIGFIAKSKIHGHGLFAKFEIPEGAIICKLDGQLISWDKFEEIKNYFKDAIGDYENYFFMEWNAIRTDALLVRP